MVSTRSATNSPVKKPSSNPKTPVTSISSNKSNIIQGDSLKIVILPKNVSLDARFVLLRHSRDKSLTRYLCCPETGLYELTAISASPSEPRSVLFTRNLDDSGEDNGDEKKISSGYVNKTASYMTATSYDLAFLLISILGSLQNKLFQPIEDLLEAEEAACEDFGFVMKSCPILLVKALDSICDSVEAGDEKMFRYSEEKVLHLLIARAESVVARGLPKSMEERFVTRPLEMPMLSVKREDTSTSQTGADTGSETPLPNDQSIDSQSSIESSASSAVFSEISTASSTTTVTSAENDFDVIPENVIRLQRLRIALRFIMSSLITPSLAIRLEAQIQTCKALSVDWTPLNDRIAHISAARAEAAASRSLGDFSRKRGSIEDDEDALANAEARAEKKRRIEEEEKKKKAGLSKGVRDLAKVDVKGMKKMSAFFTKKPTIDGKAKT